MDQELKDYLDRKFDEVDRRFADVDRRFAGVDRRLAEVDRGFAEVRQEVHQTQIMLEKLDGDVRAVAEGVAANREEMHRLHEENRRELREFRDVMEAAYTHLERRVSRHDEILEDHEQRLGALAAAPA